MNRDIYYTMKNYFMGCLISVSLLAQVSCSSSTQSPVEIPSSVTASSEEAMYELSPTQFESSGMILGTLEMKTFHEVVKATGVIDVPPENRASVGSYFGGTVKDIRLLPGEKVEKGQLLFTLENPDFVQMQQDYLEAKGSLSYLKSDYERQKNLMEDNIASQKNFRKAESDYTVTRVKVESLGKKLSLMNINPNTLTLENIRTTVNVTSPIPGFVTQVSIARGAFLNPSQTAITIVDTDHLHLELNFFEKDFSKVKIGQPIKFRIQEASNTDYDAVVHLVNQTVDQDHRTIGLHGHLKDESISYKFNPGMYIEADVYSSTESKASLPEEALVDIDGSYFALVLQDSSPDGYSFVKREIVAGTFNDGFVEVLNTDDFKDGAKFLVRGAFNLITE